MAREQLAHRRGFVLGVVHAAWVLNRMHGQDQLAEELLLELGPEVDTLQRLARREEYHFARGFWPGVKQRRARSMSAPGSAMRGLRESSHPSGGDRA